jgi:hypothetical protein
MNLLYILFVLIIIGVVLYVINSVIPMDGKIKQIINILVVVLVVFWLVSLFFPSLPTLHVGR